jgi:hypothetical protein
MGAQPGQRRPHRLVQRCRGCDGLDVANRLGWRLPSLQELTSLIDPTQSNPALPAGSPFQGIASFLGSVYWTAATAETDANAAKAVDFSNGSITQIAKLQLVPLQGSQVLVRPRRFQRFESALLKSLGLLRTPPQAWWLGSLTQRVRALSLRPSVCLIGRTWQSAALTRWVCLSRKRHSGGHDPFEPADPIPKIGYLLAHAGEIDRGVAHTLVEQDDLAQCSDRVAIEAHAAAVSLRRWAAGSRFDGPAKVSVTLR